MPERQSPSRPARRGLALALFLLCLAPPRDVAGAEQVNDGPASQSGPADLTVNAEGKSYDSKPSLCVLPGRGTWMAWHAYHKGCDRVTARRLGPGEPGPVYVLSEEGTVHDAPVLAAAGQDSIWAFWAASLDGRWRILGRRFAGGQWEPGRVISDPAADAIFPAATRVGDDVVVSWCAHRKGQFQVWGRALEGGVWQPPVLVSQPNHDSFRSVLAVDEHGRAWVFWDSYLSGDYAVLGKTLLPDLGPIERISPEGENCLVPTALAAESGLHVAWLRVADVIGGEGAVTQWHTLHVAVGKGDRWQLLRDGDGDSAAATLTHGLIARIEPEPVATGGYMGRRRRPMLLEDDGAVWLLWERKSDHRGRTPAATGELIGRRLSPGRWHDPAVLHEGYVDYHLAHPPQARAGKLPLAASDLPRKGRRIYHLFTGDVNRFTEFRQD
ncbi:MAG: hypothetical protein ACYTG0_13965, partial [Planctomycetota bacterium]